MNIGEFFKESMKNAELEDMVVVVYSVRPVVVDGRAEMAYGDKVLFVMNSSKDDCGDLEEAKKVFEVLKTVENTELYLEMHYLKFDGELKETMDMKFVEEMLKDGEIEFLDKRHGRKLK